MFSYDDYMLEMLSEAVKGDELRLVISDTLKGYLNSIDHPIAKNIIESADSSNEEFKVTYLDIDDSDSTKKDMVSFMTSNKAIDAYMKNNDIVKDKEMTDTQISTIKNQMYSGADSLYFGEFAKPYRSKTKIGRIVGKLYPGKFKQSGDPGNDIESFVNMFKAARDTSNFAVVEGSDIQHWYNEKQYVDGGGQLNSSCMRYNYCSDYLDLYSDNPDKISLVILMDPTNEKKIKGRAILWELDEPSGRTFMDRIYTVNDSDVILFKDYAKENGWIHKEYQNMSEDGPWVDTKTGKNVNFDLLVKDLDDPGDGNYPYMDTMKFFDGSWISNNQNVVDDDFKKLESTEGGYENQGEWSDFYEDYIDPEGDGIIYCDRYEGSDGYRYDEDCFYSEFYGESICNEYAERNMTELDYSDGWGDQYRDYGDYITTHEGNTCSEDYAEQNFAYSEYHDGWIEDYEHSDYHDGPIAEDEAVEVYTDVEGVDTDWRIDNESDGSWWRWEHDGQKYCDEITEEELREHHDLDDDDDDDDDDED